MMSDDIPRIITGQYKQDDGTIRLEYEDYDDYIAFIKDIPDDELVLYTIGAVNLATANNKQLEGRLIRYGVISCFQEIISRDRFRRLLPPDPDTVDFTAMDEAVRRYEEVMDEYKT